MAEAFLRKIAGDHFEVYSAGFKPKPIHPLTFKVMEELGFDLSKHASKNLEIYLGRIHFGIIVTVCAKAEAICPTFPGISTRIFWPFEDPAAYEGTDEMKLSKFREVRDQIKEKILQFLKERHIPIKQ
jgi:arsenate reductase